MYQEHAHRHVRRMLSLVATGTAVVVLAAAPPTFADPNEIDLDGAAATDQSPALFDATASAPDYTPAAPTPMSPSGPATAGSYTTELWSGEETQSLNGLQVISSTAAGTFAITGLVLDASTGEPIPKATVSITYYMITNPPGPFPCGDCFTAQTVSTTSDAAGGFGFINVPSDRGNFDLAVSKKGFGSYTVTYIAMTGATLQTTVILDAANQSYDASLLADTSQDLLTADPGNGYISETRVPPSILVAQFSQTASCAKASSTFVVRRYPWRFYILHTMASEIDSRWGPAAGKATGEAIQSYAWYRAIRPSGAGGADIDNTTNHQCFKPWLPVARSFNFYADDILSHRIVDSAGLIKNTQYKAGTFDCGSGGVPADQLSQNGARALEDKCGVTDWTNIVSHYYGASGGTAQAGKVPTIPCTSFDNSSASVAQGQLRLNFASRVSTSARRCEDGTGRTSDVAWRYIIGKCTKATLADCVNNWTRIYNRGYSYSLGKVPTSFVFTPGECAFYRVRGVNPVGSSARTLFSEQKICPK